MTPDLLRLRPGRRAWALATILGWAGLLVAGCARLGLDAPGAGAPAASAGVALSRAASAVELGKAPPAEAPVVQSGHAAAIRQVAFHPDGRLLASVSADRTVKLFDVLSGLLVHTFREHRAAVACVAFSADGQHLATGDDAGVIHVFELATLRPVLRLARSDDQAIAALAFTADGRRLLAGSWQTIELYALADGRLERTLRGHTGEVKALALTPDGRRLVSVSSVFQRDPRGEIIVWDVGTYARRAIVPALGRALAMHPAGRLVAVAGDDTATLLTLDPPSLTGALDDGSALAAPHTLAFARTGLLAAGSRDGTLTFYDLAGRRVLGTHASTTGHARVVAFSPDGATLVTAEGSELAVWDPRAGTQLGVLSQPTRAVTAVALSADGRKLYGGLDDGSIGIVSLGGGNVVRVLAGHGDSIRSLVVSRRETHLASIDAKGVGRLWDLGAARVIDTFPAQAVAFSPDDRYLATGAGRRVRLWSLSARKEKQTLTGDYRYPGALRSLSFSADGRYVVTEMAEGLELWDLGKGPGQSKDRRGTNAGAFAITFGSWMGVARSSPAEPVIATGAADGMLGLLSVPAGARLLAVKAHAGPIHVLAFDKNGKRIATGGADGRVKIWDVGSGALVRELTGHTGPVTSIVFSGDGRLVATAAAEDRALVFDALTGTEVAALAYVGERDLVVHTPEGQYLASKGARERVAIRRGLEALPANGADAKLHRPTAVLERLRKAGRKTTTTTATAVSRE